MELQINGKKYLVKSPAESSLLRVLRDELNLTGSKYGCGEGQCGACTVHLDGKAARSCQTPLKAAEKKSITTIEGLEKNGQLHPVQEAFLQADALQCGYCTPGMIMSAVALLRQNADPSEAEIISFMNGNICRCGTYPRIVKAIRSVAKV